MRHSGHVPLDIVSSYQPDRSSFKNCLGADKIPVKRIIASC